MGITSHSPRLRKRSSKVSYFRVHSPLLIRCTSLHLLNLFPTTSTFSKHSRNATLKELAEPSMSQTILFLDLPYEIRQLLYKEWFLVDSELWLDHKREGRDKTQAWNGPPIPIALLRTCATIYNEAAPFLYENNKFVTLAQPSWPESMLETIGLTPRGHITVLRLDMAA